MTDQDVIEARIEARRAYKREWNRKNPDKVRAHQKAWIDANPEKVKAYRKAWTQANKDKVRAYHRAWVKANPDKVKAIQERYWTRKAMNAFIEEHRDGSGGSSNA